MEITLIKSKSLSINRNIIIFIASFAVFVIAYIYANTNYYLSPHWENIFKPVTLGMISGRSPYEINQGFYNPPWALIPLIPLAYLPDLVGRFALSIFTVIAYGFVAHKMGAKPWWIATFLLSPMVVKNTFHINLDWMVALGFIMPPWIGLFFVLVKPQVGIGIAIYWACESWRSGGVRELARLTLPVLVALCISAVLYGPWMAQTAQAQEHDWNSSIWPWGLMVGLPLLLAAIKNRDGGKAILASPFLSTYFALPSLAPIILGGLPNRTTSTMLVVGSWLAWIFMHLGL